MCYAIPGLVENIDKQIATISYFGEERKAHNEIDELKIGDYVYAQGGYIIKKIPSDEAKSIISVWKETFFELQEVDLRLSRLELEKKGITSKLGKLLDKAAEGRLLNEEDYLYLLNIDNKNELDLIYKTGNFLRQKYLGNSCCVHGIIEFSNFCKQKCNYCGISVHNKELNRYRMSIEDVCSIAYDAIERYGFKALVLQSGEDPEYTIDEISEMIKRIKKRSAVLIFVSVGEVGIQGLKKLYEAGARGLLMRFETSNPILYAKIHPGLELKTRIEHLKSAYEMGYLIITGSLIGLPGQTYQDILNDILLTKELNAEMHSFGPFISHPNTPLSDFDNSTSKLIMKTLAVARFIDPENAKILITTAFETIDSKARESGLLAGANSVMLNVTPDKYNKDYSIYPNRAHSGEKLQTQIDETLSLLMSLGRAPTDLGVGV